MATNEGRRPVPRAIIEVRNLRKEYPVEDETVVALDRVNLSIPQGQICCIFGESGSGKSTLLNQLAGMEKPTRGGVRIGGVPVSKLDERELAAFRQKHLGFVFQSYNLLPNLTALENVAMPLMFRGVWRTQTSRARPSSQPLPAPDVGRPTAARRHRPGVCDQARGGVRR